MDENAKRMMDQLKADPAALRQLMQSRDGQALMQALTRPALMERVSQRLQK